MGINVINGHPCGRSRNQRNNVINGNPCGRSRHNRRTRKGSCQMRLAIHGNQWPSPGEVERRRPAYTPV